MVAKNCPDETLRLHVLDSEVTELSLLLPTWQADALEQAARAEDISVAQLLRRLVNKSLAQMCLQQPGYYYG
jgi:hypothetical protein